MSFSFKSVSSRNDLVSFASVFGVFVLFKERKISRVRWIFKFEQIDQLKI